jgi:hypothetical protein
VPNLRVRDAGREFTFQIEGDLVTVGRGDTNDIDLEDAKASKEHCRVERVGQKWKLVDLESKNGTRVNGEFKNKAWLGHGDAIQIGAAELRFGLEGATRRAGAAAPAPAAAGRGRPPEEEEEELPREPRRRQARNLPLIISLSVLGLVLFYLVSIWVGKAVGLDKQNLNALKRADELVHEGRYDEARQYLEANADPDGSAYKSVEQRIAEIRERKDAYERNTREQEANRVLSRLGLLLRSYNTGHVEVGPEQIRPLVERLKTEFAATEAAAWARREYPAWFAGRVPQRATELLAGGGAADKAWEGALERSAEFRKEMRFREARETIERFVTEREAVLAAEELRSYERRRDEELEKIDALAESVYRGREGVAQRLLVNKKYDEAIAVYAEVIEKFGIDTFARRAQAEIAKITKLKTGG